MESRTVNGFTKEMEKLVKEFSNSEYPITLKMLKVKETSKAILAEWNLNPNQEEKIDALLLSIEPADLSAKRLKLEFANLLRRPETIIEYIQKEEKFLVRRALQFSWIYNARSSRLSNPKFLVEHLFPKVSYSVRTRIIHGLSKHLNDEKLSELMFKAIESRYGLTAVRPLVPSCSAQFIRSFIEKNRGHFQPSSTELLRIAKKDFKIVTDFMSVLPSASTIAMKYILHKDPKEFMRLYIELYDKISPGALRLSQKYTKILILTNKESVIKTNGKQFSEILVKNQVMKSLSQSEMQDFFVQLLPESLDKFKGEINSLLDWIQCYPSKKKLEIIRYAFEVKYEVKLCEEMEFMTPRLIELMVTEIEQREKIVDWKIESGEESYFEFHSWEALKKNRAAFWWSFYGTDKAITKIKEFIANESEVEGRNELVPYLVKICWRNGKDVKALTDVCKYVVNRFRNDQGRVRQAFIEEFQVFMGYIKSRPGNEELWTAYTELVKLMILYEESGFCAYLQNVTFHMLAIGKSSDPLIEQYIKRKIEENYYLTCEMWKIAPNNPEIQKSFLNAVIDYLAAKYPLEKALPDLENNVLLSIINVISCMYEKEFHRSTKMTVVSIPWLFARVTEIINWKTADFQDHNHEKLALLKVLGVDSELRKMIFEDLLICYPIPIIVNHFLYKNPEKLIAHLDSVLSYILKEKSFMYSAFFSRIKTQGFPDLSAKIVEKCLETAEDDSMAIVERRNAIRILSFVWDSQNCLNLIAYFYPPESKVDLTAENYESLFEMRKAIAKSFQNFSFPVATFHSVSRFCTGDYLKLTVGSLYSVCCHAPQLEALRFLKEELLDRPVSVKKHTIRLVCAISLKEELHEFLSYLWENETNASIRAAIIRHMFTLLSDRPSNENWDLLKKSIETLSGSDKPAWMEIRRVNDNFNTIPSDYRSSYLKSCWHTLTIINQGKDETIKAARENFLNCIQSEVDELPRDFLDGFVQEQLFNLHEDGKQVAMLSAQYLVRFSDALKFITEAMCKIGGANWSRTEQLRDSSGDWNKEDLMPIFVKPSLRALHTFVVELCKQSFLSLQKLLSRGKFQEIKTYSDQITTTLKSLLEHMKKVIPDPVEIFMEEFILTLSLIFIKKANTISLASKSTPAEIKAATEKDLFGAGKEAGKLFDSIVSQFNPAIVGILIPTLEYFFMNCYYENISDRPDAVFFAEGILHCDSNLSQENQIIISELLPIACPKKFASAQKYKKIHDYLSSSSNKTVRLYMLGRLTQYY